MIEEKFIEAAMQESWYQKKPGTSSSYYFQAGCRILPNRLSISRDELSMVRKKGRNLIHPVIGQLIGQFTKGEESPLKANFPYVVNRNEQYNIFRNEECNVFGSNRATFSEAIVQRFRKQCYNVCKGNLFLIFSHLCYS